MKFGIDIGHNCSGDTGARDIRFEDELNKEVGMLLIEKLKALGHEVVYCTPENAQNLSDSLRLRCEKANSNKADLFISIHFNYGGGNGTEVYAMSQKGREIAFRVLQRITDLGYENRGVKDGSRLYVIRNTNSPAILIECAFVDSLEDMKAYNKGELSDAILKGLTEVQSEDRPFIPSQTNNETLKLQRVLNRLRVKDYNGNVLIEDGIYGINTKSAVLRLQAIFGLYRDGIAGPVTWNTINTIINKPILGIKYHNTIGTKYIQWRLGINIDGIFGYITRAAVAKYQKDNGLVPDGIVGENTWKGFIG